MDLMDILGGAFGAAPLPQGMLPPDQQGPPAPGAAPDLQSQLIMQLGGDPAQMRRQAIISSLGQMGSAMLAGSGPSTEHHSFAQLLGQGLQAGQQGYAQNQGQAMGHLQLLENMRRTQLADQKAQKLDAQDSQWRTQLDDPDFVAKLPASVQPYAAIIKGLPSAQAIPLITNAAREEATAAKAAEHEDRTDARQQNQFGQQLAMQGEIAKRQIAAQAAAAGRLPPELSLLPPEERADAVRARFGLIPKAGAAGMDVFDKNDATAAAKEAARLQSAIPDLEGAVDASANLVNGLKPDPTTGQIRYGDSGRIAAWKAAQPEGSLLGGSASLTPEQQEFQKHVARATMADIPNLHTRLSNAELAFLGKANPSLGNDPATNLRIASELQQTHTQALAAAKARLSYIQQNHSLAGMDPFDGGNGAGARVQPAAAIAQPPPADSNGRPIGLPATAIKGPDGKWYDPSSGKAYTWK